MHRDDRPRVLNVEPLGYSASARAALEAVAEMVDGPYSRSELIDAVATADGLIVRLGHAIDDEVLSASPRLHVISSATTGLDHIDLEAAARRGVTVLSLKGETEFLRSIRATSEHTWAILLALVRRIHRAHHHVENGGWDRDRFRGQELAGRRLGIVGFGRIGSRVCQYGLSFGMDVMAYDPYLDRWPEDAAHAPSLQAMLERTDVLTIHVPLNDETRGMIGGAELGLLPSRAIVVNTSRGGIVDEAALLAALESGHLAGAALDVLDHEDALVAGTGGAQHPLLAYAAAHDNLLLTPHLGGATHESMASTEEFMALKLRAWLTRHRGEGEQLRAPPSGVTDPAVGSHENAGAGDP